MRWAIFESISTKGGHEVDFDRIIVEEYRSLGQEVTFYVPEDFVFRLDYKVPAIYLKGKGVSYSGLSGWRKSLQALKREWHRQHWYRQLYQRVQKSEIDGIIIPTSTYRYLRALNVNKLKKSSIPVVFILHGINPKEAPKFFREAEKLLPYSHIKLVVLTFEQGIFGKTLPNVYCVNPPAYTPRDIIYNKQLPQISEQRPLRLGFFGQYRREKKLDVFLEAFLKGQYTVPVQLLIQGATNTPEDAADFQRIIHQYANHKQISFLHKGLFGAEWQEALAGVDALLMPYSAERYRYHWAGMLFNAIGYQKPVIVSSEINPEVTQRYEMGKIFETGNPNELQQVIQEFINTFPEKAPIYAKDLAQAYQEYSPNRFAKRLIQIAGGNP